eukprot:14648314-Alexandrium_andersonii.AAC.1
MRRRRPAGRMARGCRLRWGRFVRARMRSSGSASARTLCNCSDFDGRGRRGSSWRRRRRMLPAA